MTNSPQCDITGFNLIPGRNDEILICLTRNTFGAWYRVSTDKIIVDGEPFTRIGQLCEYITSSHGKNCVGVAYAIDEASMIDSQYGKKTYACDLIQITSVVPS